MCWIRHTLRKPTSSITRQALKRNPQGMRKRGRPKHSMRCELITNIEEVGYNWGEIERMAQDRRRWRIVAGGICTGRV